MEEKIKYTVYKIYPYRSVLRNGNIITLPRSVFSWLEEVVKDNKCVVDVNVESWGHPSERLLISFYDLSCHIAKYGTCDVETEDKIVQRIKTQNLKIFLTI
jgi:hypothetical protein